MKIDEAIKIIIETKYDVVEGNKEDFEDAVVTLATEAVRSASKTAEWLPVRDTPFFEYVYACSTCGRECGGSRLTNYCGDCGSKMSVRRD